MSTGRLSAAFCFSFFGAVLQNARRATECFCFNQQPLAAGDDTEMPMQFYLDPEIPAHITTLTLSYTLYDMTADATAETLAQLQSSE